SRSAVPWNGSRQPRARSLPSDGCNRCSAKPPIPESEFPRESGDPGVWVRAADFELVVNLASEIVPVRIGRLNQVQLPLPIPLRERVFATECCRDFREVRTTRAALCRTSW